MLKNIFPIEKNTAKNFVKEPVFQGHIGQSTAKNFEENHLANFLKYLSSRQNHWTTEKIQKLIFAVELTKYVEDNYRKDKFPIYYDNAVHYIHGLIMQITDEDS